jgi:hypothetical protein
MSRVAEINKELVVLFRFANDCFYEGKLPSDELEVTVQAGKGSALGWFVPDKVWKDKSGVHKYEINMSAEFLLYGGIERIVSTLLHEMAHFYNEIHGIKDVSSHQYHNKKFKDTAEKHGLNVEKDDKRGFSVTSLNSVALDWLSSLEFRRDIFTISRGNFEGFEGGEGDSDADEQPKKKRKGSKLKKWSCGCTNIRVGAGDIDITCNKCKEKFEFNDEFDDEF